MTAKLKNSWQTMKITSCCHFYPKSASIFPRMLLPFKRGIGIHILFISNQDAKGLTLRVFLTFFVLLLKVPRVSSLYFLGLLATVFKVLFTSSSHCH